MNTQESCTLINPFGKTGEGAKFVIDDVATPFILSGITDIGQRYTFTFWVKSEAAGNLTIHENVYSTSVEWSKYSFQFAADSEDFKLHFDVVGTYYIYHPKLEIGNKATDWTPAPEDVDSVASEAQSTAEKAADSATAANERITTAESLIQQLSNCIAMLVTDENGESLMTQTDDGWTFSMKETNEAVSSLTTLLEILQQETGDTQATVEVLRQAVSDHGETLEYVTVTTYEDEPCIELGESDSNFKLMITNTRIMFMNGANVPTYINTNGIVTQNIEVKGEIVQGGYVMLNTSDGGWGLLWKGVSG